MFARKLDLQLNYQVVDFGDPLPIRSRKAPSACIEGRN